MSVNNHIESLKEKHQQIEAKLHEAYIHHVPEFDIVELKKKKLQLKDEIQSCLEKVAA